MRLIISSLDNLSSTTISRSHTKKTSPTGESIDLVYTVQPTNLPVTGLTNTIKYFDAELGVAPETELGQWQKIGGTWQLQNTSIANPVNNTVVANSTGFGDTLTLAGTVTEALPVTRCNPKDFKAKCEEGIMHINWFVYTEINNYGFEIQSNDDPINNPQ